jgi:anti-sigma regulatory factor (Ser/Thr protein kinase)
MVALLWEAGALLDVLELERMWNDLARELPFSLLCAYRSDAVSGSEHAEALQEVHHLHTAVWPAPNRDRSVPHAHRTAPAEISGHFPAERDAPGRARRFVSEALDCWGASGATAQDAQLAVTELATNAVLHAQSPFSVVASRDGSVVRISVHDASPVVPTLRDDGPLGTSGRGLRLLAAIADDWGVEITTDGKTVWAELRL